MRISDWSSDVCSSDLQAAVEGVEAGVALVGAGVDARGLGIALAAQLLRVALGLGGDHRLLAVGLGTDLLRRLVALGAQPAGDLLALRAHAPVHVADPFAAFGQVAALDPQVVAAAAPVALGKASCRGKVW